MVCGDRGTSDCPPWHMQVEANIELPLSPKSDAAAMPTLNHQPHDPIQVQTLLVVGARCSRISPPPSERLLPRVGRHRHHRLITHHHLNTRYSARLGRTNKRRSAQAHLPPVKLEKHGSGSAERRNRYGTRRTSVHQPYKPVRSVFPLPARVPRLRTRNARRTRATSESLFSWRLCVPLFHLQTAVPLCLSFCRTCSARVAQARRD